MRAKTCVIWVAVICVGSAGVGSASAGTGRAIFRCELDGVPTFSDRPCALAAEQYEPDPVTTNTHEPPPAWAATPRVTAKPKVPEAAKDSSKHKETCERLAQKLKDARSQLRAGYKAKEGERIKERQARLKSQLRLARCG